MPVVKLNGESVGDGKVGAITKKLQEGFTRYIDTVSGEFQENGQKI